MAIVEITKTYSFNLSKGVINDPDHGNPKAGRISNPMGVPNKDLKRKDHLAKRNVSKTKHVRKNGAKTRKFKTLVEVTKLFETTQGAA